MARIRSNHLPHAIATATLSIVAAFCTKPAVAQPTPLSHPNKVQIVKGNPADIKDFPWQVAILNGATSQLSCGGSIIDDNWVLTAAHCVVDSNDQPLLPGSFIVVAGTTTFASGGTRYTVDRVVPHSGFTRAGKKDDIALLHTATPITGPNRRPVQLTREEPNPRNTLTISGWGVTAQGATSPSPTLQKLDVVPVPRDACNKAPMYPGEITYGKTCAGNKDTDRSACQGDSGGPLIFRASNGVFQMGVLSYGLTACAGKPTVYTMTGAYIDWINDRKQGLTDQQGAELREIQERNARDEFTERCRNPGGRGVPIDCR